MMGTKKPQEPPNIDPTMKHPLPPPPPPKKTLHKKVVARDEPSSIVLVSVKQTKDAMRDMGRALRDVGRAAVIIAVWLIVAGVPILMSLESGSLIPMAVVAFGIYVLRVLASMKVA